MEIRLNEGDVLNIRLASPKDAKDIIAYVKRVGDESNYLTFTGAEFTKTIAEEEQIIQNHIETDNKIFIVGEIDGVIVSILNAGGKPKPRLKHVIEFGVSVSKEQWGKGIGRHMVVHLINWATKNPVVHKINLMVVEHNIRAIELYKKLGFQEEGLLRKDFFEGGKYYDGVAMGMIL